MGSMLRDMREKVGVSQHDLAQRLKKPQSFVSNYEQGQRRIDLLEFLRIANALGIEPVKAFAEIRSRVLPSKRVALRR